MNELLDFCFLVSLLSRAETDLSYTQHERNRDIFLNRVIFKDTYFELAEKHSLTIERVSQIVEKRKNIFITSAALTQLKIIPTFIYTRQNEIIP